MKYIILIILATFLYVSGKIFLSSLKKYILSFIKSLIKYFLK